MTWKEVGAFLEHLGFRRLAESADPYIAPWMRSAGVRSHPNDFRTWVLAVPVPEAFVGVEFDLQDGLWTAEVRVASGNQGSNRAVWQRRVSAPIDMDAAELKQTVETAMVEFARLLERGGSLGYVPEDDGGGRSPELQEYLETALWTGVDDSGDPLDDRFTPDDFILESELRAKGELASFLKQADEVAAVLHDWFEERGEDDEERDFDVSDLAHDFWLTRNGHGTGFWDRPEKYGEELAKGLTALAKKFREVDVYETDDGKVAFG